MKLSLPYEEFAAYVYRQVNHLFPDGSPLVQSGMRRSFELAVDRTAYCFRHVSLPGYSDGGEPTLNHLHSDQYAVFLWFLSSSVWQLTGDRAAASKLFYANKVLHGLNCMYDTALPDIFLLLHTTGTVLGKAAYGDYFVAAQGCTVGAQHGSYPVIGEGVAMLPNSSVIGKCLIGDHTSIGIGVTVYGEDIPAGSVVYKETGSGKQIVKPGKAAWADRVFKGGGV